MELSPPRDLFNFDKLPPDSQRKIALTLKYKDILNICGTKKILNVNICNDPYFWKAKLQTDFGINRNDLGNKYRAYYELLLAKKYDNKNEVLLTQINDREDETPDYILDGNSKELDRARGEIAKLTSKYENNKRKADRLYTKVIKVFPINYEPKYYLIEVGNDNTFINLFKLNTKVVTIKEKRYGHPDIPIDKFIRYLKGRYNFTKPLTDGTFIVFSNSKRKVELLAYIYKDQNRLYVDTSLPDDPARSSWSELPRMMQHDFPPNEEGYLMFMEAYPSSVLIIWDK